VFNILLGKPEGNGTLEDQDVERG